MEEGYLFYNFTNYFWYMFSFEIRQKEDDKNENPM